MNSAIDNIIRDIRRRIDETRRAKYREELLRSVIASLFLIVLFWSVLVLTESLGGFSATVRTILMYLFWIASATALVWYAGRPLLRSLRILPQESDDVIARTIGMHFPSIGDRLENALDLSALIQKGDVSYSTELVEVSLEHFQRSTSSYRFSDAVPFATVRRNGSILSVVSLFVLLTSVIPGTPFAGAADRLWHHDVDYIAPAPFLIVVEPGNAEVVKGESVLLRATLNPQALTDASSLPHELTLSMAEPGVSQPERVTIERDSAGAFRFLLGGLKRSTRYSFSAGDVQSREYLITVFDRPFLRSMNITITPPAYTRLSKQVLEQNVGDIVALPGSRIEWTLTASKPLKEASVVFTKDRRISFQPADASYHAWYTARVSGPYWIDIEDTEGVRNTDAVQYRITVIPDGPPSVRIVTPGRNLDVTKAMQLPMEFSVNDDFGISQLKLAFRLVQSRYTKPEEQYGVILPFDTVTIASGTLSYDWDISVLGLVPEDVVEYYAEVLDNDAVNGPKSGRSESFLIRLPSLEEIFADADQLHSDASKELEQSLRQAEDLKKDIEQLSNDMKRNQQADWQKQNTAAEMAKKYQDIKQKIDAVNRSMESMTQSLQRNNTLSQETLEKYTELQKMLSDLNSPEFQQALKRMQQAMQNVSPDQLREAMKNVQFSEEQFRAGIERTINLLKRVQIEQKVDEMVKRAAEMQREQQELQRATEQMNENDTRAAADLSRRQEDVQKQLSSLDKAMEDLRSKMEEFPKEMPMDKLRDAEDAARDKDLKQAMDNSAQNLRSMRMEQALTAQQQAGSRMQNMSQQLSELQEQLLNNQMQQTMNALRKAMGDMLQLSQQQEDLKNRTKALDPNSQQFRDVGQEQQGLQGDLNTIANGLAELSQRSFVVSPEMGKSIGRAMAKMQEAMTGIEQRNAPMTSQSQGEAMAQLNRSATQLQQAMQSMQQSGGQGGGSLLQQLRNMALQQQSINMQSREMSGQEGLSQQQLQEMGRLARQQEEVRKSLEQLQKEAQASPEKNRVLGDLQKIADEMKEVVEHLRQNDINPNTLRQQERILSRLLQAQHSTRERDYEEKRQATTGTEIVRKGPSEIAPQSLEAQRQRDLQRALEAGYSKDYIELIRRYYEALNKSN